VTDGTAESVRAVREAETPADERSTLARAIISEP